MYACAVAHLAMIVSVTVLADVLGNVVFSSLHDMIRIRLVGGLGRFAKARRIERGHGVDGLRSVQDRCGCVGFLPVIVFVVLLVL